MIWWLLTLGVAVGFLPLERPGRRGWIALGLLGALAVWTGASLLWTDASGATWIELGRVVTYCGVLGLGLSLRRDGAGARALIAGVGAALGLLVLLALFSRLMPGWFPRGAGDLFEDAIRLGYPVGYWNGLAALGVIAFPLLLAAGALAERRALRALATALLPAFVLTGYLTFSRAAIVFLVLATLVYLMLTDSRPRALAGLAAAALGGWILIRAASARDAFEGGLADPLAAVQGEEMLAIVLVVSLLAGALNWLLDPRLIAREAGEAATSTRLSRRTAWITAAAVAVALAAGGLGFGGAGAISDAWTQFQDPSLGAGLEESASGRFAAIGGNGRAQFWGVALDQFASDPVVGTGAGTFAVDWLRERPFNVFVRNAHSLYLETLGELGVVGFALILGLVALVLIAAFGRARQASGAERTLYAGATAGCVTFVLWAGIDWLWQVTVLSTVFLLLAAAVVGGPHTATQARRSSTRAHIRWRLAAAAVGLIAIAATVVPTVTAGQLASSRAAAAAGDVDRALSDARQAAALQPRSAAPRLQKALVLELRGELPAAVVAAHEAAEREPADWQNWLVLARLEERNGDQRAAQLARKRAEMANPLSPQFE